MRQRDDLIREGRLDWLDALYAGLEEVAERLREFPRLGAIVGVTKAYALREWPFAEGLPYLVHYAHPRTGRIRAVWLIRLWHFGQRRSTPDLSGWPWSL